MQSREAEPDLLIEIAIEPLTASDRRKLDLAVCTLLKRGLSFGCSVDQESGQTILKGADERDLEVIVDLIKREFKIDAAIGAPQVAYRETITGPAEVTYTHKKQTGGSGQFAGVKLRLSPASGVVRCMGEVIGDLHHRRSQVIGIESRGDVRLCSALVPLANMFGYANSLRLVSHGEAQFQMRFDHYEAVPPLELPPENFPPAVGMRG